MGSPILKLWMLGWRLHCHPGATVQLSPQLGSENLSSFPRSAWEREAFPSLFIVCRCQFAGRLFKVFRFYVARARPK